MPLICERPNVLTVGDEHPVSTGYEAHYGLVESPFSLTPDPRFLFESRSHGEALAHVMSALRRRETLVVITGEVGTGKTMLCRTVLARLQRRTFLSIISNPLLTGDDLLKQILIDFGVRSKGASRIDEASCHDLIKVLQQFLASLNPLQAHAVVMIDEAQHLQPEVLEYVRLLSNFEIGSSKLLQIILVGQPELEHVLSRPEMRQLEQRVSRRCQLTPLETREVQHYIERRLWVAHGGPATSLGSRSAASSGPEREESDGRGFWRVGFTQPAMRAIAELSGGLPRVINVICDRSLEVGSRQRTRSIDAAAVLSAARQLKIRIPVAHRLRSTRHLGFAASLLVVAGLGWWGVRGGSGPSSPGVEAIGSATRARVESAATGASERDTTGTRAAESASVPATLILLESESFTIVVASFRTTARAGAFVAELEKQELPAYAQDVPGGWHQVMVGPYASRAEAEQAQRQLVANRWAGSQIVSSETGGAPSSAEAAGLN